VRQELEQAKYDANDWFLQLPSQHHDLIRAVAKVTRLERELKEAKMAQRLGIQGGGAGKKPYDKKNYSLKRTMFLQANAPSYGPVVQQRTIVQPYRGSIKGMDTILTVADVLSTTNTNGSCVVLNLVQQGAGSWNRVGRKIKMKAIRLRVNLVYTYARNATTADIFGSILRMVLVYDKQPSGGAIPAFDSIFGNTDQTGNETTSFTDPVKYDVMSRFRVIRDDVCTIDPNVDPATTGSTNLVQLFKCFDVYANLGAETVFGGQTNPMTIADIQSGALYLYFRSNTNAASAAEWTVLSTSTARLRYIDS